MTILTIATGKETWGQLALNLALSIKTNNPEIKTALIYTDSATKGLEDYLPAYFDYAVRIYHNDIADPAELAYYAKTQLYTYAVNFDRDNEFIFLDADTIMLPDKNPANWFNELQGLPFTAYCNDVYNYTNKSRKRTDYTFWCKPEKAREYFGIHPNGKMPQINSSFLYWERCDLAKHLFETAAEVWCSDFECDLYHGNRPDEFAFNVACAKTNILPHKAVYRPIYMQYQAGTETPEFVQHHYNALGFAGDMTHDKDLLAWYNRLVAFYKKEEGIKLSFEFVPAPKENSAITPMPIVPKQRTLFRRGELPNSDGGVFNPDAVLRGDDVLTVFRKEKGIAKGVYVGKTAYPHITYKGGSYEPEIIDVAAHLRLEDFRLFNHRGQTYCNCTVCSDTTTSNLEAKCALMVLNEFNFKYLGIPKLPIETNRVEKNWVFTSVGDKLYCIYSLEPYMVFVTEDLENWQAVEVKQPKLKWPHKTPISNSTNPIMVGDSLLMFFHTKENGTYYHGAVLIDPQTMQLQYATQNSIPVKTCKDGIAPKVEYVSGALYLPATNTVRMYLGEADTHAVYNDYDATELLTLIKSRKNELNR